MRAIYAYGEAIRSFEEALKIQEVIDPEDKEAKCDLLMDLCDLIMTGETRRVIDEEVPKAFSLAEEMGDRDRASRISIISFWAIGFYSASLAWETPEAALWAERANRYADPDTLERANADMAMGITNCFQGNFNQGISFLNRAIESARLIGDNETFWLVNYAWICCIKSPQHAIKSLNIAEELMAKSRVGVSLRTRQAATWNIMCTFLSHGIRHRAEEVMNEIRDLADRTNQPYMRINSLCCDCITAILDGRLEEAVDINRRIAKMGREFNISGYSNPFARITGLRPRLHLGKAESSFRDLFAEDTRLELKSFYLATFGQVAEANETIDLIMKAHSKIKLEEDETMHFLDVSLLEASLLIGNNRAAVRVLKRFTGSLIKTTGRWHTTCIARHLGAAAAMLGKYDEARSHYHEALKVATDMRFRPEIALTRFQMTELLLYHYPEERADAVEHLDFAINEFREMKMQPYLEKAQVLKGNISA